VRLFVEPDDGVQPVVEFIGGARQTLDVAMYLLSDRDVIDALEASRRRGVQVRVMLEENPFGSGPGNRATFDRLKAAGIRVQWGAPKFQFDHEKFAVADRKEALVGTANWTYSAFVANREYLLRDAEPNDVAQLDAIFDADWERGDAKVDDPRVVVSPTNSRSVFLAMARSARSTIEIETEEMEDQGIERALVGASRRGVSVAVVLPVPAAQPDVNATGIQQLKAGGVQVRELRAPYVHGKVVLVDGREVFVGSENFSRSSLDENREVGLLVSDPTTIQQVKETFSRDWKAGKP